MTTEDKNKVIAEFMGVKPKRDLQADCYYFVDSPWLYSRGTFAEVQTAVWGYVKYHSSWDWLMPVIQKLFQAAPIFQVSIEECESALPYKPIEEVFEIVYQWIQKINNNN